MLVWLATAVRLARRMTASLLRHAPPLESWGPTDCYLPFSKFIALASSLSFRNGAQREPIGRLDSNPASKV